jgi:hypothetical protein
MRVHALWAVVARSTCPDIAAQLISGGDQSRSRQPGVIAEVVDAPGMRQRAERARKRYVLCAWGEPQLYDIQESFIGGARSHYS